MPHVIIEHSANLADHVDVGDLVAFLHREVLATGLAPIAALRTRALRTDHYVVADGEPANVYVAVTARLGPGRTDDDKRRLITVLADAVENQLGSTAADAAISVEFQEIDADLRVNRNGLRARIGDT